MQIALVIFGSLVGFAAAAAAATPDDATPKTRSMTMSDALARAELQSPLVVRALDEQRVTTAQRAGAAVRATQNPFLSGAIGGRWDRSGSAPPARGIEWGLRLEIPFEIGAQRATRLTEVDRLIELASTRVTLARIETRSRTKAAYVATQLAHALVTSARQHEELAARLRSSAEARVKAGAASEIELHLADAERGRVEHERLEAEHELALAEAELRHWLALAPDVAFAIDELTAEQPTLTVDCAQLVTLALRQHRSLAMLVASGSALDAQLVRLRREIVPNPIVFAEVGQQQPRQTFVGGGLGIALPIFARNQGAIAVSRAERSRVDSETQLVEREIALDVTTTFNEVTVRRAQLAAWTLRTVPAAEQAAEMVESGWHAGKLDLFRVVQLAREAAEARRHRIEALGQLWSAIIALERAMGTP